MTGNQNNFDVLRLALAVFVMLVHARILSGSPALDFLTAHLNTHAAVLAFFVVSGYLITMSCKNSRSLGHFVEKRARRLLPAYVTVVTLAAAAGALLTEHSLVDYLTSSGLYRYLAANLTFLQFLGPSLPGVFVHNPYMPAVNGALWSIRSEVLCYCAVPLLCAIEFRIGRAKACLLALGVCLLVEFVMESLITRPGAAGAVPVSVETLSLFKLTIADCGLCFALGSVAYFFREKFAIGWFSVIGAACLVLLTISIPISGWLAAPCYSLLLAGSVLFFALRFPYLGNWGRYGDISYGVYIYHFPVIQAFVSTGIYSRDPFLGLGVSIAVTVTLAVLSWLLVESPWLTKSSHYVKSANAHAYIPEKNGDSAAGG